MIMQHNHTEVYDSKQWLLLKAFLSKNKTFKINLDATTICQFLMLKKQAGYDIISLGIW